MKTVFLPCIQFPLMYKIFKFKYVPFVYFCFYFHYSWRWGIEDLAVIYVTEYSYVFIQEFYSFWSYIQIFNPFEFIFLYGIRRCSSVILLHTIDQFFQPQFLKRLSFLHCIFLLPLSKIRFLQVCGFISGLYILFH